MAIEATRHLNLFMQDLVTPPCNQGGGGVVIGIGSSTDVGLYNAQSQPNPMCYSGIPMSNAFYQTVCDQSVDSRKRCRGGDQSLYDDILPQIHQHELEIDNLISHHTKRIRVELEEKQKQQTRLLAAAMGEGVMKKLKERDEQIQRMGKFNLVLQERVKSLFVENQLWRDLAQSNEATANSLRTNLEQVLLHISNDNNVNNGGGGGGVAVEDEESCCGSNNYEGGDAAGDAAAQEKEGEGSSRYNERKCKRCGEKESCVLLLPCRHLCLCNICGSGSHKLQTCPVCNSTMTATLHVNMS